MTLTAWFPIHKGKEIFTAKTDSGYVGCFATDKYLSFTKEFFDKPLAAANAARKLKKEVLTGKNVTTVKPVTHAVTKKKQTSKKPLKLTGSLYTVEQRESMPLLSFQEVWVVTKGDEYVRDCLNQEKKILASFTKDREKAKRFKDHEGAARIVRVLKGTLGPGFDLKRFYIRLD